MLNIEKDMSPKEKIKREAELQGLSSELKEITLGKEDIRKCKKISVKTSTKLLRFIFSKFLNLA